MERWKLHGGYRGDSARWSGCERGGGYMEHMEMVLPGGGSEDVEGLGFQKGMDGVVRLCGRCGWNDDVDKTI